MQTWICKYDLGLVGVPEGVSVMLIRFAVSILHFLGFCQLCIF